uniref:Uncharacterized protein n=1 Tax=Arundo donax TaxID=35708 RepID=A0A0A8Y1C0_ARUDO
MRMRFGARESTECPSNHLSRQNKQERPSPTCTDNEASNIATMSLSGLLAKAPQGRSWSVRLSQCIRSA